MTHWVPNRPKARRNVHQSTFRLATPDVPGQERQPADGLQEIEIQSACLRLLKHHPSVAWVKRMNTGAGRLAYEGGRQSRFIQFGFPGCPDLWGMLKDGRLLCIEVKAATGTLRPEQAEFLALVNQHNGVAFVARDPEDIIHHLKKRTST